MTSAASSGGAAGAGGVGLQNRVFAWAAVAVVAERALLKPLVAGRVVRVGAQTGFAVDDVAVETDTGAWALFQAKAGLGLGEAEDSPLADALSQAVEQYLRGTVPDGTSGQRPLDPTRDKVVLCTNRSAPANVRTHLAKALERTGLQPTGTALGHELTALEDAALKVALAHVRRHWIADGRAAATEEDLRALCRLVAVAVVDADDGDPDRATAIAELRAAVPADQADMAWSVLVEQAQDASAGRGWRDRAEFADALVRSSIDVAPAVRFAGDVARLTAASTANHNAFAAAAQLPVPGGLRIERAVAAEIPDAPGEGGLLIIGGAGCGKSAVAHAVAVARGRTGSVLLLRAGDVAGTNRLPLAEALADVLRGWPGPPATLVVDGVDALRGSDDRDVVGRLVASLNGTRWEVVATVRAFDARHSASLQRAFPGGPLCGHPEHRDPRLLGVRHVEVRDLDNAELAAVSPATPLGALLTGAGPDLLAVLRNPFNLSVAAGLLDVPASGARADLSATRTRTGLLGAYWHWRVRDEDATAREALLARLCSVMTSTRILKVPEAEPDVLATDGGALAALLSRNVLSAADGAFPGSRRVLTFAHNILFDYAVALYVLDPGPDGEGLVKALDQDPSLPLVARPSLELLADLLWEHRASGPFWQVCLGTAQAGHSLASLAFAGRLVRLATGRDDLQPLAEPDPTVQSRPAGQPSRTHTMIRHLVSAVRTPSLLSEAEAALAAPALAEVAAGLADRASQSYADATLSLDLLISLKLRLPPGPTGPAAARRAEAAVALLDACRADPVRYEALADAALRVVTPFVAADSSSAGAVARLLDDETALRQWGGTILTWLPDVAVALAATNCALARRAAQTVMSFNETRDESVLFPGGPLLALHESRSQQATHGRFMLAQAFPELCAADLTTAATIFCDIVAMYDPQKGDPALARDDWPIDASGASGWLEHGQDLSLVGPHRTGRTVARALADALAAAPDDTAAETVAVLVDRLRSAAAWDGLMTECSNPARLGAALLPALSSGALLAHDDSHEGAARVLKALADGGAAAPAVLDGLVVTATNVAARNGMSDRIADELIGCLRPDDIADPQLRARLDGLGPAGPPPVTPRMRITATTTPWSWLDGLKDEGIEVVPGTETASRALEAEMDVRRDRSRKPSGDALSEGFTAAAAAFADDPSLHARFRQQLADAASLLAADPAAAPGTPLGAAVLDVLLNSAEDPEAGRFGVMAWAAGERDTGVRGLVQLLGRQDWRGSDDAHRIIAVVDAALTDASPLVRMTAAQALPFLSAGQDGPAQVRRAEVLLVGEQDANVTGMLLEAFGSFAPAFPEAADAALRDYVTSRPDILAAPYGTLPQEALTDILTYLAVVHGTPHASATVRGWCERPVESPHAVQTVKHLRDYLRDGLPSAAEAAFRLIAAAAQAARERWEALLPAALAGTPPADDAEALTAAAAVGYEVSQQLFFASGAFDDDQTRSAGTGCDPGDPALQAFACRAVPVLLDCTALGHAQIVHEAVQILIWLAPLDEPRALTAIAHAVGAEGAYQTDSLAGAIVMAYLHRLLVEQRGLVLYDAAGLAAFRSLLAGFAAAGHGPALSLAYDFADVFR